MANDKMHAGIKQDCQAILDGLQMLRMVSYLDGLISVIIAKQLHICRHHIADGYEADISGHQAHCIYHLCIQEYHSPANISPSLLQNCNAAAVPVPFPFQLGFFAVSMASIPVMLVSAWRQSAAADSCCMHALQASLLCTPAVAHPA